MPLVTCHLIGIGGAGSGVGKTSFAEKLLKEISHTYGAGWGALKYTRTALYTSVSDDEAVLKTPGKDTARLLAAGASKAIWVQSPGAEELAEALLAAMGAFQGFPGVLIEGNSIIELLKPDIVIFIGATEIKKSAHRVLGMADVVYCPPGAVMPEAWHNAANPKGKAFLSEDEQDCVKEVLRVLNGRT